MIPMHQYDALSAKTLHALDIELVISMISSDAVVRMKKFLPQLSDILAVSCLNLVTGTMPIRPARIIR